MISVMLAGTRKRGYGERPSVRILDGPAQPGMQHSLVGEQAHAPHRGVPACSIVMFRLLEVGRSHALMLALIKDITVERHNISRIRDVATES